MPNQQTTDTILMVRPANFGYNEATAANNAFQTQDDRPDDLIAQLAIQEFDAMVELLRQHGVEVIVAQDSDEPKKTDAVFPNNWFTTHYPNRMVTYPMFANRRFERQPYVIKELTDRFRIDDFVHLEDFENRNQYLEGTGSMILDRAHRLVYACRSIRTHERVLNLFCDELEFDPIVFDAIDQNGQAIYHTNVMMALGTKLCVICLASLKNSEEKETVVNSLKNSGKIILDISFEQLNSFAGNMIELKNKDGEALFVMSDQAYHSLTAEQIALIEEHATIVNPAIPTIEKYGGGSARCMIAEVFF